MKCIAFTVHCEDEWTAYPNYCFLPIDKYTSDKIFDAWRTVLDIGIEFNFIDIDIDAEWGDLAFELDTDLDGYVIMDMPELMMEYNSIRTYSSMRVSKYGVQLNGIPKYAGALFYTTELTFGELVDIFGEHLTDAPAPTSKLVE